MNKENETLEVILVVVVSGLSNLMLLVMITSYPNDSNMKIMSHKLVYDRKHVRGGEVGEQFCGRGWRILWFFDRSGSSCTWLCNGIKDNFLIPMRNQTDFVLCFSTCLCILKKLVWSSYSLKENPLSNSNYSLRWYFWITPFIDLSLEWN